MTAITEPTDTHIEIKEEAVKITYQTDKSRATKLKILCVLCNTSLSKAIDKAIDDVWEHEGITDKLPMSEATIKFRSWFQSE